jgi:A/G-specific adenine glycosylase
MSQQTQVSRAAEYFRKWVAKWPTVTDLAAANLEEVNEMWAGLGYYRRAKFLHEGAKKIVQPPFNGIFPHTSEELSKSIPGVGPYTAAAIASIACGEKVAVVDGNVIRVMARLRAVSGDPKSGAATKLFNKLANEAIDPDRPGDFNQAVMELGATVCVPNTQPRCTVCPVSTWCTARKAEMNSGGSKVTDYPTKVEKASKREETVAVSIVEVLPSASSTSDIGTSSGTTSKESMYLLVQRPKDNGLLAGLWEFPLRQVGEDDDKTKRQVVMDEYLQSVIVPNKISIVERKELGQAVHVFSHIRMTMKAEKVKIKLLEENTEEEGEGVVGGKDGGEKKDGDGPSIRWLTLSELKEAGLSSGVKKVLKMMEDDEKKQKTGISKFFTSVKK